MSNAQSFSQEQQLYIKEKQTQLQEATSEIKKIILGQDNLVDFVVMTMMAGGHVLLEGMPGVGKTALSKSLGKVFGLRAGRVQCTSDILPSDFIGAQKPVYDDKGTFRGLEFTPGDIFNNIVLVDEINRASSRSQSALLECMEERQVTFNGVTYSMTNPYFHIATQNPVEQEGTNPLTEALSDRFMIKYSLDYAGKDFEKEITKMNTTTSMSLTDIMQLEADEFGIKVNQENENVGQIMQAKDVKQINMLIKQVSLTEEALDLASNIVIATRTDNWTQKALGQKERSLSAIFEEVKNSIKFGVGTRGIISLALMAKSHAFLNGRMVATEQDIVSVAHPTLLHRMIPQFRNDEDDNEENTLNKIIETLGHKPVTPDKNRAQALKMG